MEHIAIQIFLLLAGIAGWALCSIPMLRYMVDLSEGCFRWQLIMWLVLILISVFVLKFALYSITGWPSPGTWSSRLFLGFALLLSYLVPFAREVLRGWFKK